MLYCMLYFIILDFSESSFQISRVPHFYVINKSESVPDGFVFVNKHSRIYEIAKETLQTFLSVTISSEIDLKNGGPENSPSSCVVVLL